MKKIILLAVVAGAAVLTGCASTANNNTVSNPQILTLDEALQKSAETRQKLMDAKKSYDAVKSAQNSAAANTAAELGKAALKEKVNTAKSQIEAEKQAWKDALK